MEHSVLVSFVFHAFAAGGIERSTLRLARELLARGYRVDLLVAYPVGPLLAKVPEVARVVEVAWIGPWLWDRQSISAQSPFVMHYAESTIERLHAQWRSLFCADPLIRGVEKRGTMAFARYIKQEQPDIIFSSDLSASHRILTARLRDRKILAAVVLRLHNSPDLDYDKRRSGWCRRFALYRTADKIITVSQKLAARAAGILGTPLDEVETIYNPIIEKYFNAELIQCPEHSWLRSPDCPVLLAAGRCVPQKDLPTLLRAFARLRLQREVRLIILGDGEERESLVAFARQLGICEWVSFLGVVSEPMAYMRHADLFVLSSAWEGLPNVLVEAMACGCPVISTDCETGPSEILGGGQYGPLVPVGDDKALAVAMARVLDNPPSSVLLKQRAAFFSVEHAADRYEKLIQEAYNRQRREVG